MSLSDPYITFTSGVQALRRKAEALSWGLGGALGVAADPYPHQIGTVHRILADVRIRHLISDEVGLGKTVQALMIVNALRLQDRKHKTVIVAPERLLGQWQAEAWSRGHVRAAVVGSEEVERGEVPHVLLVRPRDIQDNPGILDPAGRDLLIVDEPQSIQLEVMERVAQMCSGLRTTSPARFRQVLVLSATPRLSDPRWRAIIMEMIEPECTGISQFHSRPVLDYLVEREAAAQSQLASIPDVDVPAQGELAFFLGSVTRRISRQTRRAWAKYLPERRNETIVFEPTQSEVERLELMREIFDRNPSKYDLSAAPWVQVKAMLRSRRSARAAMEQLNDRTYGNRIDTVRRLASDDPADSRFEALLDLLSSEWSVRPTERFIIVAGDAPTIDMLRAALPRYIDELRDEGVIAVLKRPPSGTEETAVDIQQMHEAITPFVHGQARLLILGDWIQAGLNLHHTSRNIVFYSMPWDPVAVDQLIGRIDRLRRKGLHRGDAGEHFGHVRIWRLIMRGAPEEAVSSVLDTIRVFQRPLPQLSERDAEYVAASIEMAARGNVTPAVLSALETISGTWDEEGLASRLSEYDPSKPEKIAKIVDGLSSARAIEPSMTSDNVAHSNILRAEQSNEGWLRILGKSGIYQISGRQDRQDPNFRFKTIWYAQGHVGQPVPLSDLGTQNWMSDHAVFLTNRHRMSSPPKTKVKTDDGEEHGRLLRFFDHGESTHDELVQGFQRLCRQNFNKSVKNPEFRVIVAKGHHLEPYLTNAVLLSAGYADPIGSINTETVPEAVLEFLKGDMTEAQRARLDADIREFMDGLRNDQRWLNTILPPSLELRASVLEGDRWVPVPDQSIADFFKPLGLDGRFSPAPRSVPQTRNLVPGALVQTAKAAHEQSIASAMSTTAKQSFDQLKNGLKTRMALIGAEYRDLKELRRLQLENRQSDTVGEAQRDMLRGQLLGLQRRVDAADLMLRQRRQFLLDGANTAIKREPAELWHLQVRFVCIN
jgi:ATP-dependent helicase HepA